jgi:hypothetical protein
MGGSAPGPLSILAISSYMVAFLPNLAPRATGIVGAGLTTVNARDAGRPADKTLRHRSGTALHQAGQVGYDFPFGPHPRSPSR